MHKLIDYFDTKSLLTEEQWSIYTTVREWVEMRVKPNIESYAERSAFPMEWIPEMAEMGMLGPTIDPKYGGAGLDYVSYGLICQALEQGDSGIRSFVSVQSSLAIEAINLFGSDEQKLQFLPDMISGKSIGCFGLTEPNHGSNPDGMETKLIKVGEDLILNGSKMWITNAPFSQISIVWAKDTDDNIIGIIVPMDTPGVSVDEIKGKWSLRASSTGTVYFQDVKISRDWILSKAQGIRAPLSCLSKARYGISWGAIGAAQDCFLTAVKYSDERVQFGKKISSFQLTQKKLAESLTEITKAQLLSLRVGQLLNEGRARPQQISMAKRNNVAIALEVARTTRQILGAMGITQDYSIMRHSMNLESVVTYEGTHDIHLLITGKDITGENAFF